jgi:tripartite-type tricarboxylate transporter receptor subunit TctC
MCSRPSASASLQKSAGIDMVQVSYRDFAPAYQDLNQGRLHVAATGVPTLAPHHQAGTAKLLFVTNRDRSPQTPDVPTATEAGYAELTFEGTVGLYGWRGMPASLKERIAADLNAVTADAKRNARSIRRGDRRAASQDCSDPSGEWKAAGTVNVALAGESD